MIHVPSWKALIQAYLSRGEDANSISLTFKHGSQDLNDYVVWPHIKEYYRQMYNISSSRLRHADTSQTISGSVGQEETKKRSRHDAQGAKKL